MNKTQRIFYSVLSAVIALVAVAMLLSGLEPIFSQDLSGQNTTTDWTLASRGMYGGFANALAVFPNFAADQTLFVGTYGLGILGVFRSTISEDLPSHALTLLPYRWNSCTPGEDSTQRRRRRRDLLNWGGCVVSRLGVVR